MLRILFFSVSLFFNIKASQYDLPVGDDYIKEVKNYKKFQKEAFDKNELENLKKYTEELTDLLTLKKYDKSKYSFRIANHKEKKDIYEAIFQNRKINKDLNLYQKYTQDNARNLNVILKIDSLAKDFYSNHNDEKNLSDWARELITKNTYKDLELKELDIITNLYKKELVNFHNIPIFKSLEEEIKNKLKIGGDIHALDDWVSKNISLYIQLATDELKNSNIEISDVKVENFINKFKIDTPFTILDEKLNQETEITKEDASQRFYNSIGHMFSLGTQGSVDALLKLNYATLDYLSNIYGYNNDNFYINQFQKQIVDAYTTCLQGQTNRLLISLHTCLNGINDNGLGNNL